MCKGTRVHTHTHTHTHTYATPLLILAGFSCLVSAVHARAFGLRSVQSIFRLCYARLRENKTSFFYS